MRKLKLWSYKALITVFLNFFSLITILGKLEENYLPTCIRGLINGISKLCKKMSFWEFDSDRNNTIKDITQNNSK